MGENIEQEKAFITQHKADANNTIKNLETLVDNTTGGDNSWKDVVETRKKHCEAFLKSLEQEEKRFAHFQ